MVVLCLSILEIFCFCHGCLAIRPYKANHCTVNYADPHLMPKNVRFDLTLNQRWIDVFQHWCACWVSYLSKQNVAISTFLHFPLWHSFEIGKIRRICFNERSLWSDSIVSLNGDPLLLEAILYVAHFEKEFVYTVELKWLEQLEDHGNLLKTWVIRGSIIAPGQETITKTRLFKYMENFIYKKN